MFKRWLIRGVFLGLLLLCVGGWGWSVKNEGWVGYGAATGSICFKSLWGRVMVRVSDDHLLGLGWRSVIWRSKPRLLDDGHWLPFVERDSLGTSVYCLMFEARYAENNGRMLYVEFPYWFLVLLFSFVLLYVWRKTRPKSSPATAFPVEITKGES